MDLFLTTPWVLPTITFVWLAIAVLTHTNGQGIKRNKARFRNRRTESLSHDERGVTLTPLRNAATSSTSSKRRTEQDIR